MIRVERSNNQVRVIRSSGISKSVRSVKIEVYPVEKFIYGETPTPETDGVETEFFTEHDYIAGTLCVTRGSLRMHPTGDYSETGSNSFTMVSAPDSNEPLIVDYIKA